MKYIIKVDKQQAPKVGASILVEAETHEQALAQASGYAFLTPGCPIQVKRKDNDQLVATLTCTVPAQAALG